METLVREIMNPVVFSVRRDDPAESALDGLIALEISGAPVLDENRRPVGMLSLRTLAERRPGDRVADHMTAPTPFIAASASVEGAARLLASTGHHRLVVVDRRGAAIGIVSPLDVLRAMLGMAAAHPRSFPDAAPPAR